MVDFLDTSTWRYLVESYREFSLGGVLLWGPWLILNLVPCLCTRLTCRIGVLRDFDSYQHSRVVRGRQK